MALKQGMGKRILAIAQSKSNWGSKIFLATLFIVLIFFWWLLIYSGGVSGHHG